MEVRSEDDIRALPPLLQEHVRQVLRAGGRVIFGEPLATAGAAGGPSGPAAMPESTPEDAASRD